MGFEVWELGFGAWCLGFGGSSPEMYTPLVRLPGSSCSSTFVPEKFVVMLPVMKIVEPSENEGMAVLFTKLTLVTVTAAVRPNSATYSAAPPMLGVKGDEMNTIKGGRGVYLGGM